MNGRSWAPTLQLDRLGTFEIAVTTMSINDGASTSTRHAVIATTSTGVDSTQATSVVYGDVPSSSKHTFVDAIQVKILRLTGKPMMKQTTRLLKWLRTVAVMLNILLKKNLSTFALACQPEMSAVLWRQKTKNRT